MYMHSSCIYKDSVISVSFKIVKSKDKSMKNLCVYKKAYYISYIIQTSGRLSSQRYRRGFPSLFLLRPLSSHIEIYSTFSCKEFFFLAVMSCTSSDTLLSKEIKRCITRDWANQKRSCQSPLLFDCWMIIIICNCIVIAILMLPNKQRKNNIDKLLLYILTFYKNI